MYYGDRSFQIAGDQPAAFHPKPQLLRHTVGQGERAARVEATSARQTERAPDLAGSRDPSLGLTAPGSALRVVPVLDATRDLILPTTITGSYPRPHWFTEEQRGRGFKNALGDPRWTFAG